MRTKIEAGKIATGAGVHMVIASGRVEHPLARIAEGAPCTWFLTPANPVTARKAWIAGTLEPRGVLTIDAGAVAALRRGKSLLPAGVIRVDGQFARGDAVVIRGPDGAEVGRGIVAYDAEDAAKIRGRSVRRHFADSRHSRPRRDGAPGRPRARTRVSCGARLQRHTRTAIYKALSFNATASVVGHWARDHRRIFVADGGH